MSHAGKFSRKKSRSRRPKLLKLPSPIPRLKQKRCPAANNLTYPNLKSRNTTLSKSRAYNRCPMDIVQLRAESNGKTENLRSAITCPQTSPADFTRSLHRRLPAIIKFSHF